MPAQDCCEHDCIERGASVCALGWPQAERPTRTPTRIAVDLRPALAVAAARRNLTAAQNEWAQAHLTDAESEDARQEVIEAEAALAEAEAEVALAALAAAPAPSVSRRPIPAVVAEADQRAEAAAKAVNDAQRLHSAAADAFLRITTRGRGRLRGVRGIARARRRMLQAINMIDKAWVVYQAMAEKVRARRALGLYVSPRDEEAATGAFV